MKLSKVKAGTATRRLAGVDIPRQDTTSFGMRAALKKGGSRYAGESGEVASHVDGSPAKARLDRPARKAGGRICKEDGGPIKDTDNDNYSIKRIDDPLKKGARVVPESEIKAMKKRYGIADDGSSDNSDSVSNGRLIDDNSGNIRHRKFGGRTKVKAKNDHDEDDS